ncbi:MAG: hypothetical protein ABUL69_02735 [Peristeroidobacter soli]
MSDTGNISAMSGQGGAVALFATPFAAVNTGARGDFNLRLAGLCESRRSVAAAPGDPPRDLLHFRGRNDLLDLPDETAGELARLILGRASAVVAGFSNANEAEFGQLRIQARAWCSIVQRDGYVPSQHFTGASWLAVYCVQAGEPDEGSINAGVLRLYERRLGSIYRDASTAELKSPFRYGNHAWTPLPGWMALFPAHVSHEVSVVRSDTPLILVFAMIRFLENA